MKTSGLTGVIMALTSAPLVATPILVPPALAQSEQPGAEAVTSLLEEVLSIVSGGLVSSHGNPPRVVRDGASYRITIPLPDLTTPTNAAIEAIARPLGTGLWDVAPLTLPPT